MVARRDGLIIIVTTEGKFTSSLLSIAGPIHHSQEAGMNPIIKQPWTSEDLSHRGIRGIDDFTVEELALLQQKIEERIRLRAPQAESKRRRVQFVRKPKLTNPA
jgi:glucokinase